MDIAWQHKRTRRRRQRAWEELSFLFNSRFFSLESDYPEIGMPRWESTSRLEVSGAFLTTLENPRDGLIARLVVLITASGLLGEKPLVS